MLICTSILAWEPIFESAEKLSQKVTQDSDPYIADWNNDGLADLIVGYRTGSYANIAKIRWYENTGSIGKPIFTDRGNLKSGGSQIEQSTECCTGACNPHIVDYNNDGYVDIIFSTYYGKLYLYKRLANGDLAIQPTITCDDNEIDDGYWCGPQLVDWNEDGYIDLLTAGYTGGANTEKIYLYLNIAKEKNSLLFKSSHKSALSGIGTDYRQGLRVFDLNMDGKKDIVGGCNNRDLYFYENIGTNSEPIFNGKVDLQTESGKIVTRWWRSRVCVWDWNADSTPDIVTGDQYGNMYLYLGIKDFETGVENKTGNNRKLSFVVIDNNMVIPVEINSQLGGNAMITFYDLFGKKLYEQKSLFNSKNNMLNLDISSLVSGVVVLKVTSGNLTTLKRIIINH